MFGSTSTERLTRGHGELLRRYSAGRYAAPIQNLPEDPRYLCGTAENPRYLSGLLLQHWCSENAKCQGFAYRPAARWCELMDVVYETTTAAGERLSGLDINIR